MLDSKSPAPWASIVILLVMGLSFSLTVPAASAGNVKSEVYSFPVRSESKIVIENESGNISVESWEKNICEINVFKSGAPAEDLDAVKIQVDERPDRLRVR